MAIFELNRKQRQKLRIFSICILTSFLVWCLFAMANKYTYRILAPLRYVNAPDNKAFSPLQSDTVSLEVEGTGWQILFSKLQLQSTSVKVDLSSLKTRNWVIFSSQMGYINRQFDRNQRVVSVSPDTLYFDFSQQTVKKVPIVLDADLSFKTQYGVIDSVVLQPDMVTVSGPEEDIAQITRWETNLVSRENIDGNVNTRVALKRNEKANINVYPSHVEVRIPVGEITEKVLEIPVKIIHAAEYASVTLVPSKVQVRVMVSLQNYADITRDSFEAVVDLNAWKEYGVSSLPVMLSKVPEFCTVKRISPQNIDFILRK